MKFTTNPLYYFIANLIMMMVFLFCFNGINTHVSVSQMKTIESIFTKDTSNTVITEFSPENQEARENRVTRGLQNTDSIIQQVNKPENEWYWFIGINIYPDKLKNN